MAQTWFRWRLRADTPALALIVGVSLLAPAAPGRADPFGPALPDRGGAGTAAAAELRPTYTLRGYTAADHFAGPEGIAIDARNRVVYVADTGKGRIVGFSLQGLPKFELKIEGITAPKDLTVDDQGRLFVADKETPAIRAVDSQGKTVLRINLSDAGAAGAPRIRGLAVDSRGRLYVGDQAGAQVLVCDADGRVLSRIGAPGEHPGQLKMIEDVALDREGRVYVVDSVGTPVNVFDPRGKFIFRFGRISSGQDDLRSPVALATDRLDQLWVVDQEGHSIQVFDGRGFKLRRVGSDSLGAIPMFLFPSALALDGQGTVYVVEKGASQVRVFALNNPFLPFYP